MSSYLNCCTTDYSRNSTNIREFLYWYTPDGENYPYRGCAVDLAGNAVPLPRTDFENNCYPDPHDVPACGTNGMGKGAWPAPFPTQTFEKLSILRNVSFTYSGTEITAYYLGHGLKVGNETFTISNQSGTNSVLNGSWTVASIYNANTFKFNVSIAPTAALNNADLDFRQQIDFCKSKGFKVVHAKKLWNGRYGFISDYVANPKVSSKFKEYNVSTQIADSVSDETNSYGNDGSLVFKSYGSLKINGNANSKQSLTAGGVRDCYGSVFYAPGAGQSHERFPGNPSLDSDRDYWRIGQGPGFLVQTDYPELSPFNDFFKGKNENGMKDSCGIDSDRAVVRIPWPWHFNTLSPQYYQGTIDGFAAWVEQFNIETNTSIYTINGPIISGASYSQWDDYRETKQYTISNYSVTETSITFKIGVSQVIQSGVQLVNHNEEPQPRPEIYYGSKYSYNYIGSYTGNASLSSEYTAGACEAEALSLLNQWDMTNDSVYPWRTDGNCGVAPMVIIKETTGGIGFGYCDTHADISSLAAYDGSIYGKPLAAGYYNKGWFDFIEDECHYTDDGFGAGTQQLCYTYGNYAPDYLPTTTTHWTDGALDTNDRGGFWQPFSRFKSNYQYELPPFVNHGCAFSANNQEAFWVSKWAELKEPLPSQNYWGVCGVQPNQCALDSHGGAFSTCEPMRDLHVLEVLTCEITADLRYPNAFAICGKSTIASISVNMFGYTRIIHSSTPYLRVGDKIDLLDAAGNRPYFNITVTDVVSDTEFYCGTGGVLPTGVVAVASWGSPDPNWYDLSPKGYFVRTNDKNGVITSQEGNVRSTGASRGIIAIVPAGSPELSSPVWPARSTVFYTDYPYIQPTEHWYSAINQAMSDRFWITNQDAQVSDGDEVDPHCAIKQKNGMPCIIAPCDPVITPLVEARLHAPTGAPLQFATDSLHQWNKMTPPDEWGTTCSNVWNYGESPLAFANQYGVGNNYADSINTTGISTDTDTGWGLADQYFIP